MQHVWPATDITQTKELRSRRIEDEMMISTPPRLLGNESPNKHEVVSFNEVHARQDAGWIREISQEVF